MQKKSVITLLLCIFILLSGCNAPKEEAPAPPETTTTPTTTTAPTTSAEKPIDLKTKILPEYLENFDDNSRNKIDVAFLAWLESTYGRNLLSEMHGLLANGSFGQDSWHALTGSTFTVLYDIFSGALDPESPTYQPNIREIGYSMDGETVLNLVGDVSLAENWRIMPRYDERDKGVAGILSERVIAEMRSADIALVNNEFTFSDRGEPLEKSYTFHGSPSRVSIYQDLGVDIVSLANNHAYDYGTDAFLDTLYTLDNADIPYIGGGNNLAEAMRPRYFIVNGRKIAYVAATRGEKYDIVTPAAGADSPGVLRTYDSELFLQSIREARQNSDYVIAYVHWGTEDSHEIEDVQKTMGYEYIDAGADIVIGSHAHVLQGIEFYKGKPIVYNLGNFIFNSLTLDTGMLKIHIKADGTPAYEFLPCIQEDCYTRDVDGDEKERILNYMEDISFNVKFDENGYFSADE